MISFLLVTQQRWFSCKGKYKLVTYDCHCIGNHQILNVKVNVWPWALIIHNFHFSFRDIPVDFKYIAEPGMHSIPSVTLSPNQKWLGCQSLDNQIMIYDVQGRFRVKRKKVFKGHMVRFTIWSSREKANFKPCGNVGTRSFTKLCMATLKLTQVQAM